MRDAKSIGGGETSTKRNGSTGVVQQGTRARAGRDCMAFLGGSILWLATVLLGSPPTQGAATAGAARELRPPVSPFGNVEEFEPVVAKMVRFVSLETNGGNPVLDELEIFTDEATPRNIALRDTGARPWAPASEEIGTIHRLENINDGRHGNESSWLAGSFDSHRRSEQTVDLTPLADWIDKGVVTATLSALLGGWGDQEDSVTVQAAFMGSDSTLPLGQIRIGPVTAKDRANRIAILPREESQLIPPGTRRVLVVMEATRTAGQFNDGYADNVSLVLSNGSSEGGPLLGKNLVVNGGAEDDGDVGIDTTTHPSGWNNLDGRGLVVWPYTAKGFQGSFPPDASRGKHLFVGGRESVAGQAWVQIEFPQTNRIRKVVWSRDRTGIDVTRTPIRYRVEVSVDGADWRVVASSEDRKPYPQLIEFPMDPNAPSQLSATVARWSEADGLPAAKVNDTAQTPDGYLWISTDRGLARFDGNRFKVFDGRIEPALDAASIGRLYCDARGRLWIQLNPDGDSGNNLAYFENGVFSKARTHGLRVLSVRGDDSGAPWLVCREGVVPWRDGQASTNSPLDFFNNAGDERRLIDQGDGLWFLRGNTLERPTMGGWMAATNGAGAEIQAHTSGPVLATRAKNGGLWIADGGIDQTGTVSYGPNRIRLLGADGSWGKPIPLPWQKRPFNVTTLREDATGHIWLAAARPDFALYRFAPGEDRYELYGEAEGLSDTMITSMKADREGRLWVGTRRGGINLMRPQSFATPVANRNGVLRETISVAPSSNGGIWICQHGMSLFQWDGTRLHRLFTTMTPYWTVLEDSGGGVWSSGWQLGGRRYQNGKWIEAMSSTGEEYEGTTALMEDRKGRVWLGGRFGVACHDHDAGTHWIPPDFNRGQDLVISLREAPDGAIWMGTLSGYLHRLEDGKFQTAWRPGEGQAFPICALYFDALGGLWFSRFGDGLTRLKDGVAKHFGQSEDVPTATINGILEDAGLVWMTSKVGVYQITKGEMEAMAKGQWERVRWRHFTTKDGLPSNECHGERSQPSICATADGRVWVATTRGVAVVNPRLVPDLARGRAMIEEVHSLGEGNQNLTLLRDGGLPRTSGVNPMDIRVPPGRGSLVIRYTGIEFMEPSLVTFQYRLLGVDRDWVNAGDVRSAIYSALQPGDYRFELIAKNKSGERSEPAALSIRVLPFWWETRAFHWTFGVLLATVGPLIYWLRVRTLQRRHQLQRAFSQQLIEREELERKRVAQQVHDVLGHELLLLKTSAVQGANASEPNSMPQGQFERISTIASRALDETREISRRLRPVELDRLGLNHALESLLDSACSTAGLRVFKELDDLGSLLPVEFQLHIYRMAQEGLNNLMKHARATTVMFEIKRSGDWVRIRLEDDGVGFDPDFAHQNGGGMGLTGMEERARLLGGEFEVTSAPGKGTQIQVTIPIPSPSPNPSHLEAV